MTSLAVVLGLVAGTFVSEDAASVAAGLLVQRGEIGALAAIAACGTGIFIGDLAVWGIGRTGGRVLGHWSWLERRTAAVGLDRVRRWLEQRPAQAIVGSRFLPGSRLPLYFAAGLTGMPLRRFAPWTAFSVVLWTPAVVLTSAFAGDALMRVFPPALAARPTLALGALLVTLLATLMALRLVASPARWRAATRWIARHRRWEFWPAWLFYLPVAAWIGFLAIRYRGLRALPAANPGIPGGGVVGESKFQILSRLPAEWVIPSRRLGEGAACRRTVEARAIIEASGWTWPLVLKPDVGQRGVGVKLARSMEDVDRYLGGTEEAVLLQPFHPGPFEAGLFYARHPDEARGRILAITDKRFPMIIGDGRRTLAELIDRHPRYRLQAALFRRRHAAQAGTIIPRDASFPLGIAGNHAQGTEFRDGAHLWTTALEARADAIARAFPGFHIGRFDVRYSDVERFRAGEDLAIVELNGATGEPTSIYDPRASIVAAYRGLFKQWALVFRIGDANRRRGASGDGRVSLPESVRAYLRPRTLWDVSD